MASTMNVVNDARESLASIAESVIDALVIHRGDRGRRAQNAVLSEIKRSILE